MAPALNSQLPEHPASRPMRPWMWRMSPIAAALSLELGLGSPLAFQPTIRARAAAPQAAPAQPATQQDAPIPLPQPQGQSLLEQSAHRADYGPLSQEFLTQANLAYCGVASIVMVLNSLGVPAPVVPGYRSYRFWTQDNIFTSAAGAGSPPSSHATVSLATSAASKLSKPVISAELVARQGMTLEQLEGLLASHGLSTQRSHGDQLSLEAFRTLLRRNTAAPQDRLLVNYLRRSVGQEGGGHISPIAAYHAPTDRVLILDTARYRYPAMWVSTPDLWRAIRAVDSSSGRSRGVVEIKAAPAPRKATLPLSP